MKRQYRFFFLFLFSLAYFSVNAQDVKVIDNKGTLKNINKVTEGTKPTTNLVKGDIYYDSFTNPTTIEIWDGSAWRPLNTNQLVDYIDTTTAPNQHKIGELNNSNGSNTIVNETVTTVSNTVSGHRIADYTNENGSNTTVNETITTISQSASNTNTQVIANSANTIATYTNENGSNTTINETVTSLSFRTITGDSTTANRYFIDYLDEKSSTNSIEVSGLTHTGTTGSIFFAGTNGAPTEDNAQLFWDDTNNRLRIGSALSGTNKLSVNGVIRSTGFNNSNGTVGQPSYRFSSDSDTGMFRGSTANNLSFSTGGTEALRIDASQDVGIGTTAPEKKLDVNGEVKIRTLSIGDANTDNIIVAGTDGVLKNIPVTDIQSEVSIIPTTSGMASRTIATHSAGGTTTVTNIYETVTVLTDTNTATDLKTIATYTDENGSIAEVKETITNIVQADSNTLTQVNNATPTANTIATYTKENGDTVTINETVTSFTQNQPGTITSSTTDPNAGDITYINEKGATQKANIVSSDVNNSIQVGSDGGAYLNLGSLVHVGHFIINYSDNGSLKEIRGLPFKPSKITFVAHINIGAEDINSDNDYDTNQGGNNDNVISVENSFGSMNGYASFNPNINSINQQVIFVGGHGNSINDISRYASNNECIGLRFGNQNGRFLGSITASLSSFDQTSAPTDYGFTINVTYTDGSFNQGGNGLWGKYKIRREDIRSRSVLVMYTAYR